MQCASTEKASVFLAVASRLIGEEHMINGVSVYINPADPKGSKDQKSALANAPDQLAFPFAPGNFTARAQQQNARYFGAPNNAGPYSTDMQANNPYSAAMASAVTAQPGFSAGNNFSMMNPAVLAAALGSWNSMINGMFGDQMAANMNKRTMGQNRQGWQGHGENKGDGASASWGNKTENKWSQ